MIICRSIISSRQLLQTKQSNYQWPITLSTVNTTPRVFLRPIIVVAVVTNICIETVCIHLPAVDVGVSVHTRKAQVVCISLWEVRFYFIQLFNLKSTILHTYNSYLVEVRSTRVQSNSRMYKHKNTCVSICLLRMDTFDFISLLTYPFILSWHLNIPESLCLIPLSFRSQYIYSVYI